MKLAHLTQHKRLLYAGASVAVHAALLAVVLGSTRERTTYHEVPVSFREPVIEERITGEPGAELEAVDTTGAPQDPTPGSVAGAGGRSSSAPEVGELVKLASTDFSALRASLVLPSPAAPAQQTSDARTLAPADPQIHLTQGTIDRLVSQPHSGVERGGGGGGWGGVQVGMGGGCND
jgi:hypothetical protein